MGMRGTVWNSYGRIIIVLSTCMEGEAGMEVSIDYRFIVCMVICFLVLLDRLSRFIGLFSSYWLFRTTYSYLYLYEGYKSAM